MTRLSQTALLHRLAHSYGVQTSYYDVFQHRKAASPEALLAVLRALGAPLLTLADATSAWREYQQAKWRQWLEPVTLAWGGEPPVIEVRLPSSANNIPIIGHLALESGEQYSWRWFTEELSVLSVTEIEGAKYLTGKLSLPDKLPWGYHRFTIEIAGTTAETLVISAPSQAYPFPNDTGIRTWGVFLPLYALHSQQSWGGGDFSSLDMLIEWISELGGNVVATLPLLPAFLDDIFEPSPYLPISRLFWNEFYLDVTTVPDLEGCPSAQDRLTSSAFQNEIDSLRRMPLVDYQRQMALKRRILEELCRHLFSQTSDRLTALYRFAQDNPQVEDYTRFRAVYDKQHVTWRSWAQPLRDGVLKDGDYDEGVKRYHLYVQWLAHQQVQSISDRARSKDINLYLDLPLGVHPDGYDVWRERNIFALTASTGSPPDAVFTRGQNWSFPPLDPQRIREQGYRYVIAYLRHHLQHAGILRIDHVMSLHRLFWIPHGLEAKHGVYVRYNAEELYAILALESQRHRSLIVGEDLGTVPRYVRPTMSRHGLHRMYTVQYELASNTVDTLHPVPRNSVASLNTHDMPPFVAFWRGKDIDQRLQLGFLDKKSARSERKYRQQIKKALVSFLKRKGCLIESEDNERAVLKACLAFLSSSPSRVVLANLEDLWLETESQNVPSTREEHPNWQRKTRYSLEMFCQVPEVNDTLREIDNLRRGRG